MQLAIKGVCPQEEKTGGYQDLNMTILRDFSPFLIGFEFTGLMGMILS